MPITHITAKQERFAYEYVKTGNASGAYRKVYDVSPTCKPNTIEKRACELLKNRKVSGRVMALREKIEQRSVLSLEEHMAELKTLRDAAVSDGKWAAAIKAEELRGKLRGFYVERTEVGGPGDFANMEYEELLASFKQDLVEYGPELLKLLPPDGMKAKGKPIKGNDTQH